MDKSVNNIMEIYKNEKIWKVLAIILYVSITLNMKFPESTILFFLPLIIVLLFMARIYLYIVLKKIELGFYIIDSKKLRQLKREYIRKYLKNEIPKIVREVLVYTLFFFLSAFILSFFVKDGTSQNQIEVEKIFDSSALVYFLFAVIFAPIIEEIIFRLLPYQFIKNKYLYIVIVSFVFAAIHVFDDPNPLLHIWIYLVRSVYITYRFYKTKDVLVTISMHSFGNFISFLFLILL